MLSKAGWCNGGKCSSLKEIYVAEWRCAIGKEYLMYEEILCHQNRIWTIGDVFALEVSLCRQNEIGGTCTIRGKLYYLDLDNEKMNKLAENSIKLLKDTDQEVYLNRKRFTNLSCNIRLFQHKVLNKCRDKLVTVLLLFLKRYCLKVRHYQIHFTRH